jgi:hypothetical protein
MCASIVTPSVKPTKLLLLVLHHHLTNKTKRMAAPSLLTMLLLHPLYLNQTGLQKKEKVEAAALLHVRMAKAQRELVNKKIQEARDSWDLPHQDRVFTIMIVDYGQNMMELPYFGHEEQPGW